MANFEISPRAPLRAPDEEAGEVTPRSAIEDFVVHSRAKLHSHRAKRSFIRDVQISILVATWTVILSLPILIWPWAGYLNHEWCRGLDVYHCGIEQARPEAVCRVSWSFTGLHCAPAKPSAFLNLWGTMLLQFIFSVSVDLGSTVQLTLQGFAGTFLAWLNAMFLNRGLGFLLGGGAYAHSFNVTDPDGNQVTLSKWLPLCNNGVQRLASESAHCFLNVWLDQVSARGFLSFFAVSIDFVLFVIFCLSLPFAANPRIFALSTHVSFLMVFVDPSGDSFSTEPTYATDYLWMIALASVMALTCFFVPKRRFTATEAAARWAAEATATSAALLRHLPDTLDEVLKLRAKSALEAAEKTVQELEKTLASSCFERFAWLKCGEASLRHRRLYLTASCLRRILQRLPSALRAAEEAKAAEVSASVFSALRRCCHEAADQLEMLRENSAPQAPQEDGKQLLSELWRQESREMNSEVCTFVFCISGVLAEVDSALADFERHTAASGSFTTAAGWYVKSKDFLRALLFTQSDRATHPRFVARNAISICVAFGVGWLGIWNVMPSYSSYSAATIAVIVYTYTGATPSVTLRRLAGVVLGKVAGSILQLGLAVKHVPSIMAFGLAMWLIVGLTFFQFLHGSTDFAGVCGLTAAYAAASMIPSNGVLRDADVNTQASVLPTLMNTIIQTVLGIGLMLLVDFLLASRATHQARQRLQRCLQRLQKLFETCATLSSDLREEAGIKSLEQCRCALLEDLDKLRDLLPHAEAEPVYWSKPFETQTFTDLEAQLRRISWHFEALAWLLQMADSEQLLALESWAAMQRCWHSQASHSWEQICGICEGLVHPEENDGRVQEIREQLSANLYTFQVASKVAAAASSLPELRRKKPGGSGGDLAAAGGNRPGAVQQIFRQVIREELEPASPVDRPRSQDLSLELDTCIAAVRREVLELSFETVPHRSALGAVDLMSQVMRSSLDDIKKIQIMLLEVRLFPRRHVTPEVVAPPALPPVEKTRKANAASRKLITAESDDVVEVEKPPKKAPSVAEESDDVVEVAGASASALSRHDPKATALGSDKEIQRGGRAAKSAPKPKKEAAMEKFGQGVVEQLKDFQKPEAAVEVPEDKEVQKVTSKEDFWRVQIEAIYRRRNPHKLADVSDMLEKHKGKEMVLYRKVCQRYDLNPKKLYADPQAWDSEDKDVKDEDSDGGDKASTAPTGGGLFDSAPAVPSLFLSGSSGSLFGAASSGGDSTSPFSIPVADPDKKINIFGSSTQAEKRFTSALGSTGSGGEGLFAASSGGLFGSGGIFGASSGATEETTPKTKAKPDFPPAPVFGADVEEKTPKSKVKPDFPPAPAFGLEPEKTPTKAKPAFPSGDVPTGLFAGEKTPRSKAKPAFPPAPACVSEEAAVSSLFGSTGTSGNIFGSSAPGEEKQGGANLFGSGNLFAGGTSGDSASGAFFGAGSSGGLFGSAASSGSIFGTGESSFGSKPAETTLGFGGKSSDTKSSETFAFGSNTAETKPSETFGFGSKPAETKPLDLFGAGSKSSDTKSSETFAFGSKTTADTKPLDLFGAGKSSDTKSGETFAFGSKPAESKPLDLFGAGGKSSDTKSGETFAFGSKTADTKPPETFGFGSKPAESKPVDLFGAGSKSSSAFGFGSTSGSAGFGSTSGANLFGGKEATGDGLFALGEAKAPASEKRSRSPPLGGDTFGRQVSAPLDLVPGAEEPRSKRRAGSLPDEQKEEAAAEPGPRSKAHADVLAKRKIVRARRSKKEEAPSATEIQAKPSAEFPPPPPNQPLFTPDPAIASLAPGLPGASSSAGDEPAPSSNPFAGITGKPEPKKPEAKPAAKKAKQEETGEAEGPVKVDTKEDLWRVQIEAIYRKRNPMKLKEVPQLMEKHKGKEVILFKKVCKRYDLDPTKIYTNDDAWAGEDKEFKDDPEEPEAEAAQTGAVSVPSLFGNTGGASLFGSATSSGSLFGSGSGGSIFGRNASSATSLFGSSSSAASSGGGSALFGAPTAPASGRSLFGSGSGSGSGGSIFGPSSGSIFGASSSSGNLFGSTASQSPEGGNIFAGGGGNLFGSGGNLFGSPSSGGFGAGFGAAAPSSGASGSIFCGGSSGSSPFGGGESASLFGSGSSSGNMFAFGATGGSGGTNKKKRRAD
ncbi:unnamed protein product [Effrenium voratum]|uniref:Nuclear pore complex NUP2/50/61 domain-containing protein n=1 Tax=Effrenium voratum TaxID=2562239 RepID=A0AA36J9L7_9DINO|nr:unnamed protein product [Effrenium voratum]